MIKGVMTIVGSFEEEECCLCLKSKEGIVVQIDGAESNLCWLCAKKLVRMKRTARQKDEATTPLFDAVEAANGR